ncbi:CLUMA_CG008299, isoform A [Clunio marinus]|uniref:CLUMA_CG008299, isoform A n=1 Tax=Clunio marinus TaxID=568069 RepID=A0A1J1I3D5_9DIPT|nr:CLUMA_CG008299, isoform A [Clunio marinus]
MENGGGISNHKNVHINISSISFVILFSQHKFKFPFWFSSWEIYGRKHYNEIISRSEMVYFICHSEN